MIYIARFCKKNPKRAACASLVVEREEKCFEVALKRWKRKTIQERLLHINDGANAPWKK